MDLLKLKFSGNRNDRILLIIHPEELKIASHGTDVAGTQRIVCKNGLGQEKDAYSLSTKGEDFMFLEWCIILDTALFNHCTVQ